MTKNNTPHITIAGGGMVGLSLALLLSKHTTLKITLIEKRPFNTHEKQLQPSFDERSTALSASSIDILESMGCLDHLKDSLQAIETIHVSDRGHFGGTQLNAQDYHKDALGYVIENRHLGFTLLEQLKKTHVNYTKASVKAAMAVRNGFALTLDDDAGESSLQTDCLIVADGAQSPLRQQLGIDHSTKPYKQVAMVANVALQKKHHNIAYERFTDEGPIALLPLKDHQQRHRAALIWTLPEHAQAEYQQASTEVLIEKLHQRFGYRAGTISGIGECHFYPLTLVEAKEQVRSNVVVLGNAAHFLHPVAGQGFNLALRDCQQLNAVITDALKHSALPIGHYQNLKRYGQNQAFDQQKTIAITDQLVKLFSTDHLGLSIVRQLGLMGLTTTPYAKNVFAQIMMGRAHA